MKTITIQSPARITGEDRYAVAQRDTQDFSEGEMVSLVGPDGAELARARAVDRWAGPLGAVPALLVEMMQDPLARTFAGLSAYVSIFESGGEPTPLHTTITVMVLEPFASKIERATPGDIGRFDGRNN